MTERSREELERTVAIDEALKKERRDSDRKYAIKLVERIIFAALAVAATIIITRFLNLGLDKWLQ